MSGTLYGVGVGPGDPELMTVKAWRLVSTARVIAYLAANGTQSMARDIASPFLSGEATEIAIDMPMRIDPTEGQAAYDKGADRIAHHLMQGTDVVMLCEGDPFFYGSFMYVHQRLSNRFRTIVVPGVSSVMASAAAIGQPLCARNESFKILPATMPEEELQRELSTVSSAAIIKVGRHFAKVRQVLTRLGLESAATAIEKATQDGERITAVESIATDTLPYFTTILVRKLVLNS